MKKTYIKPMTEVVRLQGEVVMESASSMQNANGEVQHPIEKNDNEDFWAGGNENQWGWED